MHLRIFSLLVATIFLSNSFAQDRYDTIIRNGRVIDGTGTPWYEADVAINDDRIVRIGDLSSARANQVIDASGLVVAPGFIDPHTHALRGIFAGHFRRAFSSKTGPVPKPIRASVTPTTKWASCAPKRDV